MTYRRFFSVSTLLAASALVGCGGSDTPAVAPVEGTVLYKGQPVEGANVSFHSEGAPRAAYAVTDAEGRFVLSTFGSRDGAVPGDHVVTVSKAGEQAPAPATNQPPKPEDLTKMYQQSFKQKAENKLPTKYASRDTSPLKFTVSNDAPNNFNLELTD